MFIIYPGPLAFTYETTVEFYNVYLHLNVYSGELDCGMSGEM